MPTPGIFRISARRLANARRAMRGARQRDAKRRHAAERGGAPQHLAAGQAGPHRGFVKVDFHWKSSRDFMSDRAGYLAGLVLNS